jgi:cadmium resistance transport/sequestration family protein
VIQITFAAIAAFISTNVDDVFILMTLFTLTSKTLTKQNILFGQYLGFVSLIILSIAGSLLGLIIPKGYIGLLGLLPIYMGLSKFIRHIANKEGEEEEEDVEIGSTSSTGFFSHLIGVQTFNVAAITIANGGDNIGIYIPFFANLSIPALCYTITIFLALVFVLVRTAWYLTRHPALSSIFKKYNHIIFPFVLVGLGIYIIVESETHKLVQQLFQ